MGFPILNAWLCNQAFQYYNNIKIFLELQPDAQPWRVGSEKRNAKKMP
jgi:hypothetical protein